MSSAIKEVVEIATPHCEKGLGKLILTADSKDLIPGVHVNPYPLWPDDRGHG